MFSRPFDLIAGVRPLVAAGGQTAVVRQHGLHLADLVIKLAKQFGAVELLEVAAGQVLASVGLGAGVDGVIGGFTGAGQREHGQSDGEEMAHGCLRVLGGGVRSANWPAHTKKEQ